MMKVFASLVIFAAAANAQPLNCDFKNYTEQPGLRAEVRRESVTLWWQGSGDTELRAEFSLINQQPLVREFSIRKAGGEYAALATDMRPEFQVTTGKRRISQQQLTPLRALKKTDPAYLEQEKWKVFWDAPLNVPGLKGTNPDLPRDPSEIQRAQAIYKMSECRVRTDGARMELTFPGLTLGSFRGDLMYTVYRGTNLVRQEVLAKTDEPSVAYKYNGGLTNLKIDATERVVWRDTSRGWQKYEFGGGPNKDPVALRARHRLAIVETKRGSIAVFPPPHKFFFAREIELNLGYVWYRKDTEQGFSIGVRHADREEMYRPYGVSDELWQKRVTQSRRFAQGNFALYNAPPGTLQRMPVYFYLSSGNAEAAEAEVLKFTHGDTYKPLPGYKVAISHFHTHFHEMLSDAGSLDVQPPWLAVFRSLGVNIAMMSDFHGDGHPKDPGPVRLAEQQTYFEGCRRFSDKDFLIMPGEEPDAYFGGHYTTIFPRPVYWTHVRQQGQELEENLPDMGKVYHVGSAADELEMIRRERALVWQAHPRTKGSSGYPEAIRETDYFRSDRYLGAAYQSLPADLSEKRICESRCFGVLDDMNNWGAPKYLFAEGDTYAKYPGDDTYSHLIVNYVKLDRVPKFDEDWQPIFQSLRAGDFFVTTGEVLIKNFSLEGSGDERTVAAEVEWTFPLEFVEVVWGDGQTTDRQVISTTDQTAFGSHTFRIPFDAAGKKWVRFAAWDSAGNGAFVQPVHLQPAVSSSR